jgi:hypothetical protein
VGAVFVNFVTQVAMLTCTDFIGPKELGIYTYIYLYICKCNFYFCQSRSLPNPLSVTSSS